jgi:hypothetical protein
LRKADVQNLTSRRPSNACRPDQRDSANRKYNITARWVSPRLLWNPFIGSVSVKRRRDEVALSVATQTFQKKPPRASATMLT